MSDAERRRELRTAYERRKPEAGVYALRNTESGRILICSSTDLRSVRNRFEFAQATGSIGALDGRLASDARIVGMATFALEILDRLSLEPDTSADQLAADLAELEELWRAKLADRAQY
jgi:hypothetical protein